MNQDQPLSLSQSNSAQPLAEEVNMPVSTEHIAEEANMPVSTEHVAEEFGSLENSEGSDASSIFLSDGENFGFDFEEEEKEDERPPSRAQPGILPWQQAFEFNQNWMKDTDAKIGPINCNLNTESAPIEFFSLIFDDALFRDVLTWTNKRAAEKIDNEKRAKTKKVKWRDLTLSEMKTFFATIYLLGIHRLPSFRMHWQCNTTLFATQGIKSLFSRDRFEDIYSCLCLRDPTHVEPENKLYKIEPFALSIITNSQFYYRPHQDLSIDESMIAFQGRVGFKVYEPRKPIRHGLKAYVLCDAHTGYALNWKLYTGRSKETVDDIVMKLIEGLEDEDYRIYMDSYYTSVKLFQDLKDLNFGACGTSIPDRLRMTKQISTSVASLGDRQIQYYKLESDPSLLLSCWKDHKVVYLLSNFHSIQQVDVERRLRRRDRTEKTNQFKETLTIPQAIADYNAHMGGVDRFDQLSSYYIPIMSSRRWYVKVMFHLCEMVMINSYILYKSTHQAAGTKKFLRHLEFRKEVIRGLTLELRQAKHLLTSPGKKKKGEHKIDQMDLDLESTQDTMQDTTQNDFIIPETRSQAKNLKKFTKTELPQLIDSIYHARSKINIKLNFEEAVVQKSLTKKHKIAPIENEPCRLRKMSLSVLFVGNRTKQACMVCKCRINNQKEKDEIERLKIHGRKKEPSKRIRAHETSYWCETCELPVCVSPCYDDHLQQRLKQVKLNDNH